MVTKSYIENSTPCYKQEIKADLIENVRNAYRCYSNCNKDTTANILKSSAYKSKLI